MLKKRVIFIQCNKYIKAGDGVLLEFYQMRISLSTSEVSAVLLEETKVPYIVMYKYLGYPGEAQVWSPANCKSMGITLTGQAEPCVHYTIAKAKQKGVPKQTDPNCKTYKPGKMHSFGLSSVKTYNLGGSKF